MQNTLSTFGTVFDYLILLFVQTSVHNWLENFQDPTGFPFLKTNFQWSSLCFDVGGLHSCVINARNFIGQFCWFPFFHSIYKTGIAKQRNQLDFAKSA